MIKTRSSLIICTTTKEGEGLLAALTNARMRQQWNMCFHSLLRHTSVWNTHKKWLFSELVSRPAWHFYHACDPWSLNIQQGFTFSGRDYTSYGNGCFVFFFCRAVYKLQGTLNGQNIVSPLFFLQRKRQHFYNLYICSITKKCSQIFGGLLVKFSKNLL